MDDDDGRQRQGKAKKEGGKMVCVLSKNFIFREFEFSERYKDE